MSELSIQDIQNIMQLITDMRCSRRAGRRIARSTAGGVVGKIWNDLARRERAQEKTLLKILQQHGVEMAAYDPLEDTAHQDLPVEPYFEIEKEMYEDWEVAP